MAIEDLKPETIDILGKAIPITHWVIAKQLSSLKQDNSTEFTLTHHLALAVNAGVEHGKKAYTPQFETELNQAIRDMDEVGDRLRRIRKNL